MDLLQNNPDIHIVETDKYNFDPTNLQLKLKSSVNNYEKTSDEYNMKDHLYFNDTYKIKISSPLLRHSFELFPVFKEDFMMTVSTFHLPCVRAYYNGSNVYMTPSFISAHMIYMNVDYKYFASTTDPIAIINKYRMRGFGTWLNKNEISIYIKYCSEVPFWQNIFNIKNGMSIKACLGMLHINHKLFKPRMNYKIYTSGINYKITTKNKYNKWYPNRLIHIKKHLEKQECISKTGSINIFDMNIITDIHYNKDKKIEYDEDKETNDTKEEDVEQKDDEEEMDMGLEDDEEETFEQP